MSNARENTLKNIPYIALNAIINMRSSHYDDDDINIHKKLSKEILGFIRENKLKPLFTLCAHAGPETNVVNCYNLREMHDYLDGILIVVLKNKVCVSLFVENDIDHQTDLSVYL